VRGLVQRLVADDRRRGRFVAAVLGLQAVKVVFALLAARVLSPAGFAEWNQLLLVVQYSTYAQLGVTMGLNRDLSILVAAGGEAEARRRVPAALVVALATTTAFSTVAVLAMAPSSAGIAVAYALLPVLTALVLFNQSVLRALHRFGDVAAALLLESAGWLLVVVPSLLVLRTPSFVVFVDAVLLVVLGRLTLLNRGWLAGRFGRRDVVTAIASGIPLAAAAGTYTLRQTADLLVALQAYDAEVFAGLAVSTIFVRALLLVPTLTNQLWLPDLGRALGRGGTPAVYERARRLEAVFVPVLATALVVLALVAYALSQTLLSKYADYGVLIAVKVAAEGSTLLVAVLTMVLWTLRRARVVVGANLAALVPYGVVLAVPDPSNALLGAAICASALVYVAVIVVGYRRVRRARIDDAAPPPVVTGPPEV
jgi:O-antigen/teichoic acid export membrane protein